MRYFNYGSDLVDYRRGCFVISKNEHVSSRVIAELDRLADEKEAAEARVTKLRQALVEISKRSGRTVAEIAAKALKETEAAHG